MKRPSPPTPPAEKNHRLSLWTAGVFLFFAGIFFFSHDRIYYFDGLLQAGVSSNPILVLPLNLRYEWNHFLWYPAARFFYLMTRAVGSTGGGYETLQTFNSLIGAAGAALIFRLFLFYLSPWKALGWTALSVLGQVYWYRAGGAENHLLGGVFALAMLWPAKKYWETPALSSLFAMAAAGLLSAYFHLGNFAAWGAGAAVILLKRPEGKTWSHLFLFGAVILAGWIPYAAVHGWFETGGFSKWWLWATKLAHGYAPDSAGGLSLNPLTAITVAAGSFIKSVLFREAWTPASISVAALFLSLVGAASFPLRSGLFSSAGRSPWVMAAPFAAFAGLYTLWLPWNYMYWVVQWPSFCLFLGAAQAPATDKAPNLRRSAALFCAIIVLALVNAAGVILPHKTSPNPEEVSMAKSLAHFTPPGSPVVISGRIHPNLKPYIPYFAKRNRLAIDLFCINAVSQKIDPVDWMNSTIRDHLSAAIPVYITGDALQSKDLFQDFKVTPERIESIWKPHTLLPVQDFPGAPDNELYLLWNPGLTEDIQDMLVLRLKVAGLRGQAAMILRERIKKNPAPSLKSELARIDAGR